LQKPRLPESTFGTHSSIELYWQSQVTLPFPELTTAHQGPCSKALLTGTLKHSAVAETATASTNRMLNFIGIPPIVDATYPFAGLLSIDPYQNVESRN
jgi:hypothetical protein